MVGRKPSSEDPRRAARRTLLGDLAPLAVAVAAHRASGTPPVPLPGPIKRFVKFSRLPATAIDPILDVLDSDDDLRSALVEFLDAEPDEETEGPDAGGATDAWLRRGRGWAEEYEAGLQMAIDELTAAREATLEQTVREELAIVRDRVSAGKLELDRLRAELVAANRGKTSVDDRLELVTSELENVANERDALRDERVRAVRELAATKSLLADRIDEVKALRAELAGVAKPSDLQSDADEVAAAAVSEAVGRAVAPLRSRLRDLARQIDDMALSLDVRSEPAVVEPAAKAVRPSRRRAPIRVGRGIVDGSVEGARALLATPGVITLIDGYNVTMSAWPKLEPAAQRAAFERLLAGATAVRNVNVIVVYDGDDTVHAARSAGAAVSIRFTATGVEADDEIIAAVEAIDPETPVVVVSSDRRVVDGVERFGANTVSSPSFLAALR